MGLRGAGEKTNRLEPLERRVDNAFAFGLLFGSARQARTPAYCRSNELAFHSLPKRP